MATDAVVTTALCASILSVLGALFIILNWLLVRSSRIFFLKLIVYLSVANLLSSISYIMAYIDSTTTQRVECGHNSSATPLYCPPDGVCIAQAMLMLIFENASIFWTIAIAFTLHQHVVAKRPRVERLEPYYHLCCWGLALIIALTLLFTDRLGPADSYSQSWCWIRGVALSRHTTMEGHVVPDEGSSAVTTGRLVQLSVFYAPLVCAFIFNLTIYIRVGNAFQRLHSEGAVESSKERLVQLRLRLHLAVFVIVWAAPVIHRTLQIWSVDPTWLRVLHAATQCSLGTLNCIVYGCNDKTLRPYKEAYSNLRSSLRTSSRSGVQIAVARRSGTSTLLSFGEDSAGSDAFRPPSFGDEACTSTPPLCADQLRNPACSAPFDHEIITVAASGQAARISSRR